jgi:hypothetical protein
MYTTNTFLVKEPEEKKKRRKKRTRDDLLIRSATKQGQNIEKWETKSIIISIKLATRSNDN